MKGEEEMRSRGQTKGGMGKRGKRGRRNEWEEGRGMGGREESR